MIAKVQSDTSTSHYNSALCFYVSEGRMLEVGDPAALAVENWGSEHKARELGDVEKSLKDFMSGDGIAKVLAKV